MISSQNLQLGALAEPPLADPRIRVVVIDDEKSVRAAIVDLLEHHGRFVVVAQAPDGAFATELVQTLEPDLVLIDLRMPLVGGIDALHMIRVVDPRVPVVVLSAYSDQAVMDDALAAGAFAYLIKGCSAQELFDALERAWRDGPRSRIESNA